MNHDRDFTIPQGVIDAKLLQPAQFAVEHVTTAPDYGFEDVLEIGRHARKEIYRLKPEPPSVLVPRRRVAVAGRRSECRRLR